ncbi:MAG: BolA family protein, partial [Myxococcota bacterium]|nr:BolA family protein [Myxococcota bacterium]
THFNLVLVTSAFEGKRQVQRHQVVYRALSDELRSGLHALTMKTLTPTEWQEQGSSPNVSPLCLGGSKHG